MKFAEFDELANYYAKKKEAGKGKAYQKCCGGTLRKRIQIRNS